ncbi:unnamed protein product [Cyclocybe aegerita]|uniref:Uncharacterized protein n=1 Tax=Cyclocybe aegerita TaxID=1973307 RepID=A0A8S0VR56_CYCAE|nr:unnamed protein product [Cyclocybe aegerita]
MFSDQQEAPLMFVSGSPRTGITQPQFDPTEPHLLYAAYRGSGTGSIYSWDVCSNIDAPLEILWTPAATANVNATMNQELRFDLDIAGRMLGVGDQLDNVSLFDLKSADSVDCNVRDVGTEEGPSVQQPALVYDAHDVLLTAPGPRHLTENDKDEDAAESSEEGNTDAMGLTDRRKRTAQQSNLSGPITFDSSIKSAFSLSSLFCTAF